jgi:hypothetical protein
MLSSHLFLSVSRGSPPKFFMNFMSHHPSCEASPLQPAIFHCTNNTWWGSLIFISICLRVSTGYKILVLWNVCGNICSKILTFHLFLVLYRLTMSVFSFDLKWYVRAMLPVCHQCFKGKLISTSAGIIVMIYMLFCLMNEINCKSVLLHYFHMKKKFLFKLKDMW